LVGKKKNSSHQTCPKFRGNYFLFGSVFIKKNNQIKIKKKNELKPVQTDRFWFGLVFKDKNWFKPVGLGFFGLARFFFLVWAKLAMFFFL
jgi:hypothetical protein